MATASGEAEATLASSGERIPAPPRHPLVAFLLFQLWSARRWRETISPAVPRLLVWLWLWLLTPVHMLRCLWWVARVRLGPRVHTARTERCCVILLSFRRPENIDALARAILKCDFVERLLIHNNASFELAPFVQVRDERLTILESPKPVPHGIRWELALSAGATHFLSVDDDLFLSPRQLAFLFGKLVAAPSVPHGMKGAVAVRETEARTRRRGGGRSFKTNCTGEDLAVDHLLGLYLFTREHVERACLLAARLGLGSLASVGNGEDILLSFSGTGKPVVHAVGAYLRCASSNLPDVATWSSNRLSPGQFAAERLALHQSLAALTGRATHDQAGR